MSIQNINIGSGPNTGTGDSARAAAQKINGNFAYLQTLLNNGAAVENRYNIPPNNTVAAMIADQANQTSGNFQYVADASADPTVASGFAYYEYLGTVVGDLTDYTKLTPDEAEALVASFDYLIKEVNAMQLSFASYATLTNGRVFLETDNTDITFMIFDAAYTKILEKAVALSGSEDFYFNIYNKSRNTNIRPKWESSVYVDGGTKLRVAVSGFADNEVGVLETLHLGLPIADAPVVDESKWEIANINEFNLKVPTETEWNDERLSWATNNDAGAFASNLKLTRAGFKNRNDGIYQPFGTRYSSSTVISELSARTLNITNLSASFSNYVKGMGNSVRLIVNGTFTQQQFDDNYANETVTINGLNYGFVYNATTDKIWLDRNLGATQVATSATDEDAYGDLFQWGRNADGHEKRNSATTTTQATTPQPEHGDFIITHDNWLTPSNDNLWQGVDGINNPALLQKLIGKNGLKASYEDLMDKPANTGETPTNANAFTGALALNNRAGTYYNNYDLSVSGTITFSVASGDVIFGKAYVKIISDGVTPFASTPNIDQIFNEKQTALPVDYILPIGEYSFYFEKTPSGVSIRFSDVSEYVPPSVTPLTNDFILADFNIQNNTITDISGTDDTRLPRNLSSLNSGNANNTIEIPKGNFLHDTSNAYSIVVTFKTLAADAENIILSNEDWNGTFKGLRLRFGSSGNLLCIGYKALNDRVFQLGTATFSNINGDVIVTGSRTDLNDGNWHTVVMTFDGINNDATGYEVYVDRAITNKLSFTAFTAGDMVSTREYELGGRPSTAMRQDITFAQILFYNRVITFEEVIKITDGELVPTGLQRFYKGEEEDGATVYNHYVSDYLNPYHANIVGADPNLSRVNDGIKSLSNKYGYTENGSAIVPINLADITKDVANNTPTYLGKVVFPVTVNTINPLSFKPNPNGYDELTNLGLTDLTTITANTIVFLPNENANPLFRNVDENRFVAAYRSLRHFTEFNPTLDEFEDVLNACDVVTPLFAQIGQSNQRGSTTTAIDDFTDLTYKDLIPKNAYIDNTGVSVNQNPTFTKFLKYHSTLNGKASKYGPDASLMKDLVDANKTVYLFKYAIGSTSLSPSALNYWHPTDASGSGTQIYPFFLNGLQQALAYLISAGRNVEVILWQAPHESNRAATQIVYKAALQAFFDAFTADVPQFNGKYLTWRGHTAYWGANEASRLAVIDFVDDDPTNRAWHDTDLYATTDNEDVHFTIAGQEDNGQDAAANVISKNWIN